MTSHHDAAAVDAYLAALPDERRDVIAAVRDVVVANLPAGYEESVSWGMLGYEIPLARYPKTYNGKPLGYVSLAAQKNHYALYMVGLYMDPEATERFREGFAQAGKKLDMGKSCVRFKKLEDLPLDVIGEAVAGMPVEDYLARYEEAHKKK